MFLSPKTWIMFEGCDLKTLDQFDHTKCGKGNILPKNLFLKNVLKKGNICHAKMNEKQKFCVNVRLTL